MNDDQPMREMPKYQSHKVVHALKIAELCPYEQSKTCGDHEAWGEFQPADKGCGPVEITNGYYRKHNPQVGGYYVVYEDGYKSFSPTEAFESGYTLLRG